MHGTALRKALYYRFHGLLPLANNPTARGFWLGLRLCFWLIYFAFIALILVLRYAILPNIEEYRADIEGLASRTFGQPVSIGRVEASWDGINPDLTLFDVRVADTDGRPALNFTRIETILSWWSLPRAQLRLRLLRIDEPTLNLRRDRSGKLFIAGIPAGQADSGSNLADWVLAQRRIRIRGARLVWDDELRQAPPLLLEKVDFALDNDGRHHRFGLTALPAAALAAPIDIRGDLQGLDFEQPALWSGRFYVELGYTDLGIWRQWIDYPFALSHGMGALRAWFDVADGRLRDVTTDVALRDVGLTLAPDLSPLELEEMSGRIGARFTPAGFAVDGRQLQLLARSLATGKEANHATVRIAPTDFHLDWQRGADGRSGHDSGNPAGDSGVISASQVDIAALAALADYFPLDPRIRRLLSGYAPQGLVSDLNGRWTGDFEALQTYSVNAAFDSLALTAQGQVPGFSGLSGRLDLNEKGGQTSILAGKSTVDLPGVFPVPRTDLDSLSALAKWTILQGQVEVALPHIEFSSPDAAGSAQGVYRTAASGPGFVDFSAALTRARAQAVWRYMPHAVGEGARLWLRDSLLAGTSKEARLILKGDLADFPFVDKSKGEFLVTVKARDVVLDYAKGWPRIDGIYGDLRFAGNGMVVDAQRGTMLGAKVVNTHVEIPDFDRPISTLIVKGQADGRTAEFLKFIDQSPVAERIDHFTDDLRAGGNGHLDIKLVIPLDEAKLPESQIDGEYRFINNDVTVDPALPPIRQVNGTVQFSGSDVRVPEINGSFLGGPIRIKGGLQQDGNILITTSGRVDVAQLREQIDLPVLAQLSGSTAYQGEVRINQGGGERNADLVVDSALVGLSSTLPEPFAKAAAESVMLRFEKKLLPRGSGAKTIVRDQINATLGDTLALQLIRRRQTDGFAVERGAIAIGRPLQLPERGVSLELTAQRIDVDRWRSLLGSTQSAGSSADRQAPAGLSIDTVSVKADELLLLGHHFHDVSLTADASPALWKVQMKSTQATGDLQWESAGRGKLTARLRNVALNPAANESDPAASDAVKELPALDFIADDFQLGERRFGRLELQAVNAGDAWRLEKIDATSPNGHLAGRGVWQIGGGKSATQMDFKIDSNDVGGLLGQLGYPGAVRAGTAQLGGRIGWNASPVNLDYASLHGEMTLEASKGQFLKLDPGAAGKLLGLISLQGLPRRISLDFKDVFSDGLAFDSMSSKLALQGGVMRTDRLQIDGPSARVVMRGEVDLKKETQRLNVNVQPELGGTAALGVALVNPIAGVATWVAHKILQNPLNQIFSFDYLVTGTWDDPKVQKVARGAPAGDPAIPASPPSRVVPEASSIAVPAGEVNDTVSK